MRIYIAKSPASFVKSSISAASQIPWALPCFEARNDSRVMCLFGSMQIVAKADQLARPSVCILYLEIVQFNA